MKHFISLFFLALVLIISCKKKDDSTQISTTQTSTTGSPNGGTTGGGTAATFKGLCSNQKKVLILNGFTYPVATAQNYAMFSDSLFTNFTATTGQYLNAGILKLNNVEFKKTGGTYTDTTNFPQSKPFYWFAYGATVPTFNYLNNNDYPSYADYTFWPDTIRKSTKFTIHFQGLNDGDEVELQISNSGATNAVTYTALAAAKSINVSTVSIAPLITSTTGVIQCTFYKNNIQTLNGTKVNFRNATAYVKTVKVLN